MINWISRFLNLRQRIKGKEFSAKPQDNYYSLCETTAYDYLLSIFETDFDNYSL